jgi:hypothetical protein
MDPNTETGFRTTVAARVAAEDIHAGDFVTVLNQIVELPSYLWNCSGTPLSPEEPVRGRYIPLDAGQPFKVLAVCLPFVYVKRTEGGITTFDTRQHQLVRLDHESVREVWNLMRKTK